MSQNKILNTYIFKILCSLTYHPEDMTETTPTPKKKT